MIRNMAAALFTIAIVSLSICASGTTREELARQATSADTAGADLAIRNLRAMGPQGLDALLEKYAAEIDHFSKTGDSDANWTRIAHAIDTVAMQKDAYASHLFWYTDLDEAKAAAMAQNKPILTLRLLGNLNEEFSCANSRLFRAVLYPNAEISKYLRENYILHWKSVRPAPRVTIDFGDGRKIERTLTGNSIHYILDKRGEVVDALPGLYSPSVFLSYLKGGRQIGNEIDALAGQPRTLALMKYRKSNFDRITRSRTVAVETAKVSLTEPKETTEALAVQPRAMAKAIIVNEVSILRVFDDFAKFEPQIDAGNWNKLAKIYSPNAEIDQNSVTFIRRQNAKTGLSEEDFGKLFAKLGNFIDLDTTRNDFLFHTRLFQILNDGGFGGLEDLNARVYADIFKTPNSDKWLGLYSPDVYTALDGNGFLDGVQR